MAKDLVRRMERIEQQQIPTTPSEFGLIDLIFGGGNMPALSKKEFPSMLRRVMDQMDGSARLIPASLKLNQKEFPIEPAPFKPPPRT